MTNLEWINSLDAEHKIKLMQTFRDDSCSMCIKFHIEHECDGWCMEGHIDWLNLEHIDDDWEERDYKYLT